MLKLNEFIENGNIKKDELFPDYTFLLDDLTSITLSNMMPFEDPVKINKTTTVQRFINCEETVKFLHNPITISI
jgi:hypothetical protein